MGAHGSKGPDGGPSRRNPDAGMRLGSFKKGTYSKLLWLVSLPDFCQHELFSADDSCRDFCLTLRDLVTSQAHVIRIISNTCLCGVKNVR